MSEEDGAVVLPGVGVTIPRGHLFSEKRAKGGMYVASLHTVLDKDKKPVKHYVQMQIWIENVGALNQGIKIPLDETDDFVHVLLEAKKAAEDMLTK